VRINTQTRGDACEASRNEGEAAVVREVVRVEDVSHSQRCIVEKWENKILRVTAGSS
jgi:hypothetical protein